MPRRPRVLAIAILLCTMLFGAAPIPAPAQPPPDTTAGTSAVVDYGACLAGQKRGDLLLLMDESYSLGSADENRPGTDPQAIRALAARRMLAKLAEWADNTQVELDVAIAGFAQYYELRRDWVTLGAASLPDLDSVVDHTKDRTHGIDTNYGIALADSLKSFTDHRPDAGPSACRAIAWFTDGELDFGDNNVRLKLIDQTRNAICVSGGVADQIRSAGIRTFAIGLSGAAEPQDFSLLESIATGKPGPAPCGDIVTPRPGEFEKADNIDELLDKFAAIAPGPPPIVTTHGVCEGAIEPDCEHRFVLDNSVRAVKVEADAGADDLVPALIAPDGTRQDLTPGTSGTVAAGGVPVNVQWTSRHGLTLRMSETAGAQWRGGWALAFVDPRHSAATARSKSSITIYGELVPTWAETGRTLHSGEKTTLRLGIADRAGHPIDPASLDGAAVLSASIIDHSGTHHDLVSGLGKGELGGPIDVDLTGVPAGSSKLRLSLAITTAAAGAEPGTALSPELLDIPLTIAPPAGFPVIAPSLDFHTLDGAGTFTATLAVSGEGCVWISPGHAPAFRTRPPDAGAVTVTGAAPTGPDGCVPGSTARPIPVVLRVEHQSNGVVTGVIPVTAARANEIDGAVTIEIPFHAQLEKLPDRPKFWWALTIALMLGLGVPLLVFSLLKWLTARIPGQILKAQQIDVEVSGGVLQRGGMPFALRDTDFVDSVQGLRRSARRVDLDGIELRARMGWSPTAAGYVVARAPGRAGASSLVDRRTDGHGNAVLPLELHSSWFVLHDPQGPAGIATLVLLLPGNASPAQRSQLVADARDTVPGLISELRDGGNGTGGGEGGGGSRPDPDHDPFASRYASTSTAGDDPFAQYRAGGGTDRFGR
ncbi:vWA domain-containing protein [Nocardia sp. alder85J]|uniref:vWA domain-containing protein n=1 Tax=Nocardia sp. alder85J TaxID=2862949 RepID=UPI001CD61A01|nr:vWA domain-containing protein [Nocardia sp. alder85J]MCX4090924.1 VWA domain-containing protein [Nocardia sp. alder85J]